MAAKGFTYLSYQRGVGRSLVADLKSETVEPLHARLPRLVMIRVQIEPGDLLYIFDSRRRLGGLRSVRVKAGKPHDPRARVLIGAEDMAAGSFKMTDPSGSKNSGKISAQTTPS